MTIIRTDTVSGIGTEGTVFEGDITIDSLNYMTLPKGTTSQRYSLEGRDPDYHKLKLHLPLVHHTQFDDYSPASPSITANYDSHISSKSGVFENSAALFSRQGANDWIAISDSNDNDLGSDDFTIECWFMCVGGGTNGYLVQKGTISGNWSYFIQFREATDSINFYGTSDGTNFDIVNGTSFGSTILPNKWYHVAVCRSGNTFSYYINGKKGPTTDTSSASFNNSSVDLRIPESGGFGSTEEVFLQDVRLYKGVAKYNETFIPQKLAEDGAIRYNTDSNKIECYNGTKWMNIAVSSPDLGGNGGPAANPTGNSADKSSGARGLFQGGDTSTPAGNIIDYITISTQGDAVDFGDTTDTQYEGSATSSRTRGVIALSYTNPATVDTIEYVTMATTGDAVDFGNLFLARRTTCALASSTRGIFAGGGAPLTNTIDYITIASTGDAKDFGDAIFVGNYSCANVASPTRGIKAGGRNPSSVVQNSIEYITTPTLGDSQDFGDCTSVIMFAAGVSNSTRGIWGGGQAPGNTNLIQKIQIATLGNSQEFGDLSFSAHSSGGASSPTRGCFGGGRTPTKLDNIEYIAIATEGNAVDFGNLTVARASVAGFSNAHGGL